MSNERVESHLDDSLIFYSRTHSLLVIFNDIAVIVRRCALRKAAAYAAYAGSIEISCQYFGSMLGIDKEALRNLAWEKSRIYFCKKLSNYIKIVGFIEKHLEIKIVEQNFFSAHLYRDSFHLI